MLARWALTPRRAALSTQATSLSGCRQNTALPSGYFRPEMLPRTERPTRYVPAWSLIRGSRQGARAEAKDSSAPRSSREPIRWDGAAVDAPDNLDAIVVLAGGQTTEGSGLPPNVEKRMDAAVELLERQNTTCHILCSGGGTPHKPPILRDGYVYHESTNEADYLIDKGVSPRSILKEVSSYDTIGNGYFSLTIHAIPRSWRNMAVITSEFHMPRSKAIFDHCYGLAEKALPGQRFNLHYLAVSNVGIPPDVLEAREQREASSLRNFMNTVKATPSLSDFSEWMHMEHLCYAVPRQSEFGVRTISDDKALQSY
mmetsp:Transcript_32779/g.93000  ORF Transcript_32779/g.93000 Transcript_32779/m.93000 type:complete len:313 (+) Transcript_32779:136-1074(+)|eukprot:CAMPEP_0117648638 /NCGR_PEP_ID=MMETSP0804-20121206/520_1 /TAXON_ID=1074897 /ORGANISM="Tetraselmis astigmatica, Strain CCMP880" /LENGTH=312 /DNA_ID=CAMNT_0005454271 /DNA_START=64 /DNA_END=1002 /DNA_ORIENTATION=-